MSPSRNATLGAALVVAGLICALLLTPGMSAADGPAPLRVLFGWGAFLLVAALTLGGLALAFADKAGWQVRWRAVVAGELLGLALLTLLHLSQPDGWAAARAGNGGGLVGLALAELLRLFLPVILAQAVTLVGAIAAAVALWLALPPAWTAVSQRLIGRRQAEPPDPPGAAPWDAWDAEDEEAQAAGPADRLGELARRAWERLAELIERADLAAWPARGAAALAVLWRNLRPSPVEPPAAPVEAEGRAAPERKSRNTAARPVEPISPPAETASRQPAASGRRSDAAPPAAAPVRARPRPATLPPLDLLHPDQNGKGGGPDARQRGQLLKETLAEFNVPVEIVSMKEGPTVTQYGLEPGEVVKELRGGEVVRRRVSVHSIQRLSNDLALALAAASIRIEAPVPGRPYVGIEIPNTTKTMVSLRSVLEAKEFAKIGSPLTVALGRDVSGDPVVADLTRLPHLLIAGATGSGKSVCINAIVSGLLMNNGPERVKFLMVDPKMVELPGYNGVPHLLGPVITDPSQASGALAWLTLQMDDRYRAFADVGVRNIVEYNRKFARSHTVEPLPYLVLVIDELADLMMTAAFDIERQICRLAQMARATGIHLVLATQRPSVDVITGLIKANFPARIAFAVTSQIDSRVILDSPGAERLLGRGDMLFMQPESARLLRIQGCFVSDSEIDRLVTFWRTSQGTADSAVPPIVPWAGLLGAQEQHDDLLERALEALRDKRSVSTSLLQRQLRIGFPRAARLMEQLEEMGVVAHDEGGGRSRAVLLRSETQEAAEPAS